MNSKLEKFTTSGSNLKKALNKSSQNASKNFKALTNSVGSIKLAHSAVHDLFKINQHICQIQV
ncbi:hypothetical protein [Borreliella afzelii]|uniref:hypothetical protein n=1 Tax=Borreliella afzelii TaxID=29518 RepID=UPI00359C8BA4